MRHRRGNDLSAPNSEMIPHDGQTLDTLWQWERLAGSCAKCEHIGMLDSKALQSKIGNAYLINVEKRLYCIRCGNKLGNKMLIGKAPR